MQRLRDKLAVSERAALPEIAGDAALYFDPDEPEEIASRILQLLSDGDLRKRYIESGRKRAKEFDWGKTAEATLDFYLSVFRGQ